MQNAKIQFENIIRYQPDNTDALSYLGQIYYNVGSFEASINAYKKVLQLKPDKLENHYNLALSYLKNGNYKEALKSFDIAKQFFGEHPDYLYNDAMAHYKAGEVDETIKNLKELTKKYPDYGLDAYLTLALSYFYKGMADEATAQFNTVSRAAPGSNWDTTARGYITQLEGIKAKKPKEFTFSLYSNYEKDTNVNFASAPVPSDADTKIAIFGSAAYKPVMGNDQPIKIGYSLYYLQYAVHTDKNFLGHMIELSHTFLPLPNSLFASKINFNLYSLNNQPYLTNIPVDFRLTFKALPWQNAWSIVYLGGALDSYTQAYYQKQSAISVLGGIKQFVNDYLNIGYEIKLSRASGEASATPPTDDYSYISNQLSLSYVQPLPNGFSLSIDGSYTSKNYTKEDSYTKSATPTKRSDQIISASAMLAKTIIWDIGLLIKAGYYSDNSNLTATTSALGYGSYSSTTVSVGLTKAF